MAELLLFHIGELATARGGTAVGGAAQGDILRLRDAYVLVRDGRIAAVGTGTPPNRLKKADTRCVDCAGRLLTSGLVDCHTHPVFAGWREHELGQKLRGATYLDILKSGGGILSTVRATRLASEDALYQSARAHILEMQSCGTTALEAKSGYGLDLETELRSLAVIRRLRERDNRDIAATFLGAHAVPEEYRGRQEAYVRFLTDEALPAVAAQGVAGYCDVFCETGVFSAEETRCILHAAQALGLRAKVHSDEIDPIGGTEAASALGAVTADHLAVTTEDGMRALRDGGVIAVLLPATSFYLNKGYAPARRMVEKGIPVAVASDFNPGSTPNLSLQQAMWIACFTMHLTPEEILTAVTLNAAAAIGMADRLGTVEPGKQADLVLWDVENLELLLYRYGTNRVWRVWKEGTSVVERNETWIRN